MLQTARVFSRKNATESRSLWEGGGGSGMRNQRTVQVTLLWSGTLIRKLHFPYQSMIS